MLHASVSNPEEEPQAAAVTIPARRVVPSVTLAAVSSATRSWQREIRYETA